MLTNIWIVLCILISAFNQSLSSAAGSAVNNDISVVSTDTLNNNVASENGCECKDYSCGCCGHLEEHRIHLNTSVCVNITYLQEDYGISFTVTWNSVTIYNETVSARNPPPYCVGAPLVKELAEVCLRLHDVEASRHKFHACVEAEARFHKVLISKYELGCFTMGHDNATIVNEPEVLVLLV